MRRGSRQKTARSWERCGSGTLPGGERFPATCCVRGTCDGGFTMNRRGECIENEPCQDNAVDDGRGGCTCDDGYKLTRSGECEEEESVDCSMYEDTGSPRHRGAQVARYCATRSNGGRLSQRYGCSNARFLARHWCDKSCCEAGFDI